MSTSIVINRSTRQTAKLSSVKQTLKRKGLEVNLETINRFYEVPAGKTVLVEDGVIRMFTVKTARRRIEEQKPEMVEYIQAPKRNARQQARVVERRFHDAYTQKYLKDTPENRQMVASRAIVPYAQIGEYVANSSINRNRPFILTLKNPHLAQTYAYRFNSLDHLENSLKLDADENYLGAKYAIDMRQHFEHAQFVGLKNVGGGCNRNKKEGDVNTVKGKMYAFTVHCPPTKDNSCAYHAIVYHTGTELSNKRMCEKLKLPLKEKKSIEEFKVMWDLVSEDSAHIIDKDYDGEMIDGHNYVLLDKEHYTAIISSEKLKKVGESSAKVKRNILTWDCETRQTDEFITIRAGAKDKFGNDASYRSYKLKDTITSIAYMGNRGQMMTHTFISNNDKSSTRQFVDWLLQSKQKFHCYAHNGASFDNYFFLENLTEEEYKSAEITKLGLRFASIRFAGHELTDSRLHLVSSLESLCGDYKVETPKMTEFVVNGKKLTNTEMCFYKPELGFWEFMTLQQSEPEFWQLYQQYCEVDCISLYQIWKSYSDSMRQISEKMLSGDENGHTVEGGKHNIATRLTVGSGSMDLLEASMMKQNKTLCLRVKDFNDSIEKETFLRQFIRGGISHTGQAGAHHYQITDVDIASQYPAAMYHGRIPVGTSRFIDGELSKVQYRRQWHGYVHMRNLVFCESARKNKFLATHLERDDGTRVLQWDTPNQISELFLDTVSINYYLDTGLLKSFDVVKALVSKQSIVGREVYGLYIDTLFTMKAQQDIYKADKNSKLYNPSLRSSIKLCLNSVGGKCVENKLKHERECGESKAQKVVRVNGFDQFMRAAPRLNPFLPTGLSIYSNSKILLREYVECLPSGADDMIHAETDGFMFRKSALEHFQQQVDTYHKRTPKGDVRETLPIAFGAALGNIGVACETDNGVSYFLGKKNYLMSGADKGGTDLIRLKGVPQKTINQDGSYRKLVSRSDYEDMFQGKAATFTFQTLLKTTKEMIAISSHEITRKIKLNKSIFSHYY